MLRYPQKESKFCSVRLCVRDFVLRVRLERVFLIWSSFLFICCRRLRDRFIEAERLSLAMEVSTKCGLDPSGVWGAAGFALLQAGDFPGAREKFARCMKVNDWIELDFKLNSKGKCQYKMEG